MQRKRRVGVFAFSILAAAANYAEAGNTIYWFGDQGGALDTVNSGNSNWSTSQTSDVDYGQAPQAGDDLVFSADGAFSANVDAVQSPVPPATSSTSSFYGSMTVLAGQPAITLTGSNSQFLSAGDITVASGAGNLTIGTRMLVTQDAKWETDNGGTLTVGLVTGANHPNINLAGNGTIVTSSTVGNAAASAVTLHLNSGATYHPLGDIRQSVLSMDGGTYDGKNASVALGWVVGTAGGFQNLGSLSSGQGTLDIDFGPLLTSGTYSGSFDKNINDLFVRSVNSAGTWTLSGSSSYAGRTQINTNGSAHGATIILSGSDNRLPVTSNLVMGATTFTTGAVTSKLQLGDSLGPVNQTFASIGSPVSTIGSNGQTNFVSIVGGNDSISRLTSSQNAAGSFNGTLGGPFTNENNLAFTKAGTGSLLLSGTETYVGDTTISGGTLNMTGQWTDSPTFNINANTANAALLLNQANAIPASAAVTATSSASFVPSVIVNAGQTFASLTSSGSTSFTSGTSTVGPIDGTGTLAVGAGVNLSASYVRQGALSIASGATVAIASNAVAGAATSNVSALSLDAAGTLDLNNNDLIVNHASGDTTSLTNVQTAIVQAYHGGAWDQPGITSTLLKTRPRYGLGYAEASDLGSTSFDGQSVTDAVLVKYTLLGDGNLDNVVNALDFNMLASNYGAGSNPGWIKGDFNYDGTVDSLDFVALSGNFGSTVSAPALSSVVPEPVMLSAAALSLVMLTRRRRRA